jgi:hypothetical protein
MRRYVLIGTKYVIRTTTLLALVLAFLLVVATVIVDRTGWGHRMVLRYALTRVGEVIAVDSIHVGNIRTGRLLQGVTLEDISLIGTDGRPFLRVDSARAAYSAWTFFSGDVVLSSLHLFGARLTLSRYPGEEEFNLDRIFRANPQQPGRPATDTLRSVIFNDVRLTDAYVEIVQPVATGEPPSPRAILVDVDGVGERLQRIAFENIQAVIPQAIISAPGQTGPKADIRSLSMIGHVFKDPFTLTQLRGEVRWADGKLFVRANELALPNTSTSGQIIADFTPEGRGGRESGWVVDVRLERSRYTLRDLQWLIPDLPNGSGTGRTFLARVTDQQDVHLSFDDATLVTAGSNLSGTGTFISDKGEMRVEDVSLEVKALDIQEVERFTGDLPITGDLTGRVLLDGPLSDLRAEGMATLREPGHAANTADFSGTFHMGEGRTGVTDLVARVEPFDYTLLTLFAPASKLSGLGRADIRASGSIQTGMQVSVTLLHEPADGLPNSQIVAAGTVRKPAGGELTVDLDGTVSPLSFTSLRSYYPTIPVIGEVSGKVSATGPLSNLEVVASLETAGGPVELTSHLNASEPGAYYQALVRLESFEVSKILPNAPDPTLFTGLVRLEGRGTDLRTARIDMVLEARRSRVAKLDVDSARAVVRVQDGILSLEQMDALVAGVEVRARGTLPAEAGGPPGEIRAEFAAESLEGLRPLLTATDSAGAPVQLSGRMRGEATLRGSLERFSANGALTLREARYGANAVDSAAVTFSADSLPDFGAALYANILADSVELKGRFYRDAQVEVSYARPEGRVELTLVRDATERYEAGGLFALDSLGGRLDLNTLALHFDDVTWNLQQPARAVWDDTRTTLEDVILSQAGRPESQVVLAGVLPKTGQGDFRIQGREIDLAMVARLLQIEDTELQGTGSLDLRILGAAEAPLASGTLGLNEVRYRGLALDSIGGTLDYFNRAIVFDLEGWQGDLRVLEMTGPVPADLSFRNASLSFPNEPINLQVKADSLPAAFVTGFFRSLVDVEGTVAGEFTIAGTLDNPAPTGQMVMRDGAWTIEAMGVRHENIDGTFTLRENGFVDVDATAVADGTMHALGRIQLAPLLNPRFDLTFEFDNFLLVNRRDVLANGSGAVTLTGTFERPIVQGRRDMGQNFGLTIDEGTLYLEEFVRSATIVDLADPRFAEIVSRDDVTARVLRESRNPFMQNLFVDVDVAVTGDSWLRSSEIEAEIEGDLSVSYSSAEQRIVLAGNLNTLRGFYRPELLGRRFTVEQGVISFQGEPGVNPRLDILASTRVPRNPDPLEVRAHLTGTLLEPHVELQSDEAALSQPDLISYLVFGRPSYELGTGEERFVQGAAGSFVGAGVAAGVSVGFSALSGRLGTVLARQWGLDYFAITEAGNVGFDIGSVTQTQVELGRYLRPNLFAVLAFQPAQVVGSNPLTTFGVRLQYTPTRDYTLELFLEDRFLRSRALGFQDAAQRTEKILGIFLFREWGY